jgi:hypothetical protein
MTPRRLPLRDPVGAEVRRTRAQRRVGFEAKCSVCGETRPEALIEGSKPMICAECSRKANGQSITDLHHVAGRRNHSLTVPVPVNDHRAELTPAMYDWPRETRENPDEAPLLAFAAHIRGFCDMHSYSMEELLLPGAELLEDLHSLLARDLGQKYWVKLGMRTQRRKR